MARERAGNFVNEAKVIITSVDEEMLVFERNREFQCHATLRVLS